MSVARSTPPTSSELDLQIREAEANLAALMLKKGALEQKAPAIETTKQLTLHALIDLNDWNSIRSLIENDKLTPDNFKETQNISVYEEAPHEACVAYRLCNAFQFGLLAQAVEKKLITSEHLATTSANKPGLLENIVYSIRVSIAHTQEKAVNIFLDANLVTPESLCHNTNTNAYIHFQNENITESLRQKFNTYCETAFQQAQKKNDSETTKKWLDILGPHLSLTKIMQAVNLVLMHSLALSFEERCKLITKHVTRSTAKKAQQQDVIRHFIYAELNRATEEAQLVAIQSFLANNAEFKSLFQTSFFFSTNTSLWDSFQNKVSEMIIIQIDAIQKQREKAARPSQGLSQ